MQCAKYWLGAKVSNEMPFLGCWALPGLWDGGLRTSPTACCCKRPMFVFSCYSDTTKATFQEMNERAHGPGLVPRPRHHHDRNAQRDKRGTG